jgi:hypothetical protein
MVGSITFEDFLASFPEADAEDGFLYTYTYCILKENHGLDPHLKQVFNMGNAYYNQQLAQQLTQNPKHQVFDEKLVSRVLHIFYISANKDNVYVCAIPRSFSFVGQYQDIILSMKVNNTFQTNTIQQIQSTYDELFNVLSQQKPGKLKVDDNEIKVLKRLAKLRLSVYDCLQTINIKIDTSITSSKDLYHYIISDIVKITDQEQIDIVNNFNKILPNKAFNSIADIAEFQLNSIKNDPAI